MTNALGDRSDTNILTAQNLGTPSNHVKIAYIDTFVPPIMIGVDNLQDTCTIGNTTTTDINLVGSAGSLNLIGSGGPKIVIENDDMAIVKSLELKNISIGYEVGTSTDSKVVTIGNNITNSGGECVNIGNDIATGAIQQGKWSVAIGKSAGNDSQSSECVAVGSSAGRSRQQQGSISIGSGAGASRQQTNSIAIGYDCCPDTQGNDSIAIGSVGVGLPASSVVINAGGIVLTPATSGLFINPIAGGTNPAGGIANTLWWNSTTKEVQYHIP